MAKKKYREEEPEIPEYIPEVDNFLDEDGDPREIGFDDLFYDSDID